MGATRLPEKPLADICGKPMIVHVWERALEAHVGPVVVACDHERIAEEILKRSGRAVLTEGAHETGTDRIYEAVTKADPEGKHAIVINVQGDLPWFNPAIVARILLPFASSERIDMSTFIHPFSGNYTLHAPQAVKVAYREAKGHEWVYCENFTRKVIETDCYHIGIYAYRREALERFSRLERTSREKEESLEQLRVLEDGFTIAGVRLENESFVSIDTPDDLEYARTFFQEKSTCVGH